MKKEEVKGLIRESIETKRKIEELEREIDSLIARDSEIEGQLYKNRSKQFIEGVISCLADLMEEYHDENAHKDLKFEIQLWLSQYDESIDERLENSTLDEQAMYEEVLE